MSVWLGERRNVAGLVGAINIALLCGCQPVPAVTQVCSLAAPVGRSGTPLQVTGLDISTDGQTIVAALEDGTSRAWRVGPNGSADEIASLAPEKRQRKDVAVLGRQICVSADGRIVAIASAVDAKANQTGQQEAAAGFVRIWDLSKRSSRLLATLPERIDSIAIAPGGTVVAVKAVASGPFRLIDGMTGRILWSDSKAVRMFLQPVFSPNGKLIAAGVVANVRVYETQTGRVRRECTGPTGGMVAVAFSADGSRVAAGGPDPNLYVWDLDAQKKTWFCH